ncbi:unnamed protein product [Moneuplotes crassus]|uniref:Thioredoxin domain-containing protein n=1 Tax=Euplotes crassus TaxID=5936 RepID=A0AAD1U2U8_EUPCR|nr:unnamed protein product [Moneuplotes crassus]
MLIVGLVRADVEKATTADDVSKFLEANQNNVAALFFFDSSLNEGNEGGFWSGVVTSVSHIFSGEDNLVNGEHQASEIEQKISEEADLLQIDVSNEDLRELQDQYEVTTIPYVIIYDKGVLVLSEVLNPDTHDKVLDILQIKSNETNSQSEEALVVPEENTSEVSASEVNTSEEEPPLLIPEAVPATIEITDPAVVKPEVVAVSPQKVIITTPKVIPPRVTIQNPQKPKAVTLAPGETEKPTPQLPNQDPRVTLRIPRNYTEPKAKSEDSSFIKHKCHDITHPKQVPRGSPGYIAELEDYQIPEEWWEYGYSPITGSNAEEINYSRNVKFFEAENITFEPTQYKSPFMYNHYPYTAPEIVTPEPFTREEFLTPSRLTKDEEPAPYRVAREEFIRTPAGIIREEYELQDELLYYPEVIEAQRPSLIQARIAEANAEAQFEAGRPRRIFPQGNQRYAQFSNTTNAPAAQQQKPAVQQQKPVAQQQKPAAQQTQTKPAASKQETPKRIYPQGNQNYTSYQQKPAAVTATKPSRAPNSSSPAPRVTKTAPKATATAPRSKATPKTPSLPAQPRPAARSTPTKPAKPTPRSAPAPAPRGPAPAPRGPAPAPRGPSAAPRSQAQASAKVSAPLRPGIPLKPGSPSA